MLKIVHLLVPLFLVSCSPRDEHWASSAHPEPFVSNGERIYFTGNSVSGSPISSSTGPSMTGMHRQMHGGGCAVCHGADREGKQLWPQFWITAPALTTDSLFADKHTGDGHDDHGTYDSGSLRRAIMDGLDPSGEQLDPTMPRWTMGQSDLDDLIAYLQQSHTHD